MKNKDLELTIANLRSIGWCLESSQESDLQEGIDLCKSKNAIMLKIEDEPDTKIIIVKIPRDMEVATMNRQIADEIKGEK